MVLTKDQVQALEIVRDADQARFRDIGYDLTVGEIYVPWPKEPTLKRQFFSFLRRKAKGLISRSQTVPEYEIPPQGVALIFSKESVVVPPHVVGYAMPKTACCEDGLLVLNTGIVDPNYKGPLSGTIINFRDTPYPLKHGLPFLRLVFETIDAPISPEGQGAQAGPLGQTAPAPQAAASLLLLLSRPLVLSPRPGSLPRLPQDRSKHLSLRNL
jgi:deoxycytidine triphosphate deaminase